MSVYAVRGPEGESVSNWPRTIPSGYQRHMDIRVLLVTSEYPPDLGGIASHVSELGKALSTDIAGLEVVHPRSTGARGIAAETETPKAHRPALVMAEPLYQLLLHRWLAERLRRAPVDILHVHGVRPLGATRGLPARTIFTNHSSGFLARLHAGAWRKRQTARLLEHVDHLIAPSDELVEAARAFGYAGPAVMIPNGVDADRFSPGRSSLRAAWGASSDDVVILLARRLVEKNGVADFAQAVHHLHGDAWRVIIAGDGPERARMEAILQAGGCTDRVTFLGAVSNAAMPDIYRAADISVLPSHAEATSIAGLEAMATALPLVGTKVGGIPAIIADNLSGLLVEPRQPGAMAAALNTLVADRETRARFGAAARVRVEQEFAWPLIAKRTLAVYEECCAGALPAGPRAATEGSH